MRIAFVSSMKGAPWGGSEELWAAGARAALQAGHDVAVSVFDWPEPAARVVELRKRGARMLPRPLRRQRFLDLVRRPAWVRGLENFRPDVLCLSQGSAYETAGRRSTLPLFAWLRATQAPLVNIVQFNQDRESLRPAVAARARFIFGTSAANLFVARANIRQTEETLGQSIPEARVVTNPVNVADASAAAWPEGPGVRLACVARLDMKTKGQDVLLRALAEGEWRGRDWSLGFFGSGADEGSLRSLRDGLGLTDRANFRGHIADIRDVWKVHHALVLPSRAEGTPLAMVEAMLLGRVVIVTDVGGCADWVRDGENGFLAAAPTVESIGAAMRRAFDRFAEWPAIAARARQTALAMYDPDPGGTLLGVLQDVVNQPVPETAAKTLANG